jgi:arabinofuranosyltransferase
VAFLLAWTAWVADDAFISVRVADNFLRGFGPRWNIMERVQAYTHPLWLALFTAAYAITHEVLWTMTALGVTTTLAALGLLAQRIWREGGPGHAIAFVLLCGCSKSVLSYGTSGLENPLSLLLLVLILRAPADRPLRAIFLSSLLALCREDLLLVAAPIVILRLRPLSWPRRLGVLALGGLPLGAWEAFSLIYYGALVPNTALAKLGAAVPRAILVPEGLRYLVALVIWDPVGALLLVAGLGVGLGGRHRPLAIGLSLYVVYTIWIGGDFMCGRFFMVPIVLAATILCESEWSPRAAAGVALFPLFLLGAPDTSPLTWLRGWEPPWFSWGIIDERIFYVAHTGLFHPLRAHDLRFHQFAQHAREISRKGVAVEGAIGMFGYYAGPGIHIIDDMALSDPLLSRLPMTDLSKYRPGHFLRALPDGYEATVYEGKNEIVDPDLARYWEVISLVTRGPLWSAGRWRAIGGLMRGRYEPLRAAYLARQRVRGAL